MNVLGIFVKQPVAGQVKTRLAEHIGAEQAAALYAAFIADVTDRFRSCGARRVLGYAPDTASAAAYFRSVSRGDYELWPQPSGPLGERMAAYFEWAFGSAAERVVLLGSDSPTLPRQIVEQAFGMLDERDYVLGPATDGGYYLIGLRVRPRPIFDGIVWSSGTVLEQTLTRIAASGGRLGVLPPWYDVDTPDDLDLLRGHVRALCSGGSAINLTHTRPLLLQHRPPEDGVL